MSFFSLKKFQFTPVLRRATVCVLSLIVRQRFQFTPVLRRATITIVVFIAQIERFNSRPSCDGRPTHRRGARQPAQFQFTPVLRRATALAEIDKHDFSVSIHARLATGDLSTVNYQLRNNPFQFTPVLRRATDASGNCTDCTDGFNSRPSCDGRPDAEE